MNSGSDPSNPLDWWNSLRHGGMLVDPTRLTQLISSPPPAMRSFEVDRLRRRIVSLEQDENAGRGKFISFVFDSICGFAQAGSWDRGTSVDPSRWTRRTIAGDDVKPNHLWRGPSGAILPVFIDAEKRVGVGRGKRAVTAAIQWLRGGDEKLAVVTNGRQWRLIMAGLDYEAFCEWDIDRWFESGQTSAELFGLRALLHPPIWTPPASDDGQLRPSPLVTAIADSRKGQADLSAVLGERVRQAVELLIQAHSPVLDRLAEQSESAPTNSEIYRAGVRLIMRIVVGLFAESREGLLPKDNPIFHECYSLSGLRDQLQRISPTRRAGSYSAYPRVVSLFRLIHDGSSHEALAVPSYGGSLFAPGDPGSTDGVDRALHVLEQGCYEHEIVSDAKLYAVLHLLSRTKVKIRQGRGGTWIPSPVDFSSLDSEYIGILYEGLLDFELRVAGDDGPVIFLAVGNQPALPLSTLEAMDDRSLKNLLEKMKDTSSGDDGEEASEDDETSEEEPEESDGEEEDDESDDEDDADTEDESADDIRHTARTSAEAWAKRAIEVGKLVRPLQAARTPEKMLAHQAAIDRKAKQIITKVVLPGERYLVRWGGTRKGSGTFYTRPQLAIPTVHRTLRPLAYESTPPAQREGPDAVAAARETGVFDVPRRPEEILSLKVCDPACGSGSFPLAALRFLTDALYHSLVYHDRFRGFDDRTVIDLIRDTDNETTLADETLPCRPDDAEFEPRTKAVLRRYIVERCIYGVDLDPLAVELCRLSLWIETLDRRLPFTFLDHKIKCGNSLVGTWFDQFMHYPAMAWKREGGDKNHSGGIHFKKEGWTKAISAKAQNVKTELIDYIDGALYMFTDEDLDTIRTVHDEAEQALGAIHGLGIHEVEQRAAIYNDLLSRQSFIDARFSLDLWCSLWFWPPDQIEHCPLVNEFYEGKLSDEAKLIVRQTADAHRFFHWELEFPDAFNTHSDGFDAVIGNPPWDIAKPNSKEFFSALDPLYRSYGKQEALNIQKALFREVKQVERDWLRYNAGFRAQSNWLKSTGYPYGDRRTTSSNGKQSHDIPLGGGGKGAFDRSVHRYEKWRDNREAETGYSQEIEATRGFRHQGGGDINLYKMFLEQAHKIARDGGRLGMIVPSGIYSDHGTRNLRELFLDSCQWEWLFGFENREGIFDIHRSFKFNPLVICKGGRTESIQTAFMRRDIEDWESGERYATEYPRERVLQFSPRSKAILEIQSRRDLEVLEKIYSGSVLLGDDGPDGWGITYSREFDMTNDSKLFPPRTWWEERGYIPDEYSRWIKGKWQWRTDASPAPPGCKRTDIPPGIFLSRDGEQFIHADDIDEEEFTQANGKPILFKIKNEEGETEEIQPTGKAIGLPLLQGIMMNQLLGNRAFFSESGNRKWRISTSYEDSVFPKFVIGKPVASKAKPSYSRAKYAFRSIARTTDSRTIIGSPFPGLPAGNSLGVLTSRTSDPLAMMSLGMVLSSYAFDWQMRRRIAGTNVNYFFLRESATPLPSEIGPLAFAALGLAFPSYNVSQLYLLAAKSQPSLKKYPLQMLWAISDRRRLELLAVSNAVTAELLGLESQHFKSVFADCDHPVDWLSTHCDSLNSVGFWRVEKTIQPELRETVLAQIAFQSLQEAISSKGREAAIIEFLSPEGWQLPEMVRLADYGLGHDERAKQPQPVSKCFGPRFHEWQSTQTPEESWAACHLHARNVLGEAAYVSLLNDDVVQPEPASDVQLHNDDEPFQLTAAPVTKSRKK